jgi:hypothetical protein
VLPEREGGVGNESFIEVVVTLGFPVVITQGIVWGGGKSFGKGWLSYA